MDDAAASKVAAMLTQAEIDLRIGILAARPAGTMPPPINPRQAVSETYNFYYKGLMAGGMPASGD